MGKIQDLVKAARDNEIRGGKDDLSRSSTNNPVSAAIFLAYVGLRSKHRMAWHDANCRRPRPRRLFCRSKFCVVGPQQAVNTGKCLGGSELLVCAIGLVKNEIRI